MLKNSFLTSTKNKGLVNPNETREIVATWCCALENDIKVNLLNVNIGVSVCNIAVKRGN